MLNYSTARFLVWILTTVILFSWYSGFAEPLTTYSSSYGSNKEHDISTTKAEHCFTVDGVPAATLTCDWCTEWYVDNVYQGSSENDCAGILGWDPKFCKSITAKSTKIKALIYKVCGGTWTLWEYHIWNVSTNVCPSIVVTQPATNRVVRRGASTQVCWDGTDPDDAAVVTVARDHDCTWGGSGHGTISGGNVSEDGCITWSTAGVPLGNYRVVAGIDDGSSCSIPTACSPGVITVALPDLHPGLGSKQFSPQTVCPTDGVWIQGVISNSSAYNISTGSGFIVSFYASTNTSISSSDYYLGYDSKASMAENSSETTEWSGALPNLPPGNYYIGWIIDSGGQVEESDESNNTDYISSPMLFVLPPAPTPPAPQLSPGCGYVDLSWPSIGGVSTWCIHKDGVELACIPGTYNSYRDNSGVGGCYRLEAVNQCGRSKGEQSCASPLTRPSAPLAPQLTPGDGSVAIQWQAVFGASSYSVHRNDGGTWDLGNVTHFVDGDRGCGQRCYWIIAKNNCGDSDPSPQSCAPPVDAPLKPILPQVLAGCDFVDVIWSLTPGLQYQVLRNQSPASGWLAGSSWRDATPGLSENQYQVKSKNNCTESTPSDATSGSVSKYNLRGYIHYYYSGQSAPYQQVFLLSLQGKPDLQTSSLADGHFEFPSVPCGLYKLCKDQSGSQCPYPEIDVNQDGLPGCNVHIVESGPNQGSWLDVVEVESSILPSLLELSQNFPNPFNAQTSFEFAVPKTSYVAVDVVDISGRLVCQLFSGTLSPGFKRATWDGRDTRGRAAASGVYIYRLHADGVQLTRKMILLK